MFSIKAYISAPYFTPRKTWDQSDLSHIFPRKTWDRTKLLSLFCSFPWKTRDLSDLSQNRNNEDQFAFHLNNIGWAATASSATAASTGCTRNALGSSAWQRTLITDVHGTRELHAPWTADHRGKSQVIPDKLEVVASFCYLRNMLSTAGGCELSTTTPVKTTWKRFKELLPVLSSCHLSFKTRGCV